MDKKIMLKKLLIILALSIPLFGQHITGAGTADNPWLLYNAADMDSIHYLNHRASKPHYFKLANDIDWEGSGLTWTQMDSMDFYFDGNDFTISNMIIDNTPKAYSAQINTVGMFRRGYLSSGFPFHNVIFESCSLSVTSLVAEEDNYIAFLFPYYSAPLKEIAFNNCYVGINMTSTTQSGNTDFYGFITGVYTNNILYTSISNSTFEVNLKKSGNNGGNFIYIGMFSASGNGTVTHANNYSLNNKITVSNASTTPIYYGGYVSFKTDQLIKYYFSLHDTVTFGSGTYTKVGGIFSQLSSTQTRIDSNFYIASTFINAPTAMKLDYQTINGTVGLNRVYFDTTGSILKNVYAHADKIISDTELKDSTAIPDFQFGGNNYGWTMSDVSSVFSGFPIFKVGMYYLPPDNPSTIVILEPKLGDKFIPNVDTVGIKFITSGKADTVSIKYSLDGGSNYTEIIDSLVVTIGDTTLYQWPLTGLSGGTYIINIGMVDNTVDTTSDAFQLIGTKTLKIIQPVDSNGVVRVGDIVNILIETELIDSVSLYYSVGDSLHWITIIENMPTTYALLDTIIYQWTMPDIHGVVYIKASDVADTSLYVFNKEAFVSGANRPSQPYWCWYENSWYGNLWPATVETPFHFSRVLDQSCQWAFAAPLRTSMILSSDGTSMIYYLDPEPLYYSGLLAEPYRPLGRLGLFSTVDTVYYEMDEIYNEFGDTIVYKNRQYYVDTNDYTLRCNDLRNGINNIFVSDLSALATEYWINDDITLQVYNVQWDKLAHQFYPVTTDLETLNDDLFKPLILASAPSTGRKGDHIFRITALDFPPDPNPIKDIVRIFTSLSTTRDYFRGIDPKARKSGR